MIARLSGKVVERRANSLLVQVDGLGYEVLVPSGILVSLEGCQPGERVELVTYCYLQMDRTRAVPVLVGFRNEMEKEFFEQFVRIAGVGPRLAVRALALPISRIAEAIEAGDHRLLEGLPGIGAQKAREIVAKLQGKAGRFCLIREGEAPPGRIAEDIQEEALQVLLRLQHPRAQAIQMIQQASSLKPPPQSTDELLNCIYREIYRKRKPEAQVRSPEREVR